MKNDFDFDVKKLKTVPADHIEPSDYNPKDEDDKNFQKVLWSIEKKGFRQPIVVRENPDKKDYYIIIDGHQRYRAAVELGYTDIPIYNEGIVPLEEAKALTIWYEAHVPFKDDLLAGLVKELDDLGMDLPFFDDEKNDLLQMANFDFTSAFDDDEVPEDADGDFDMRTYSVKCTPEQYQEISEAVEQKSKDDDVNEGEALARLVRA
ncbi:MAG: ParB/RepB/Spo0J family partition protein [Acetobacter sp.]|nr:ParB/RepB/Spo0J family partition protein [Acetobacter sp.]